jgi:hypothetical protein
MGCILPVSISGNGIMPLINRVGVEDRDFHFILKDLITVSVVVDDPNRINVVPTHPGACATTAKLAHVIAVIP